MGDEEGSGDNMLTIVGVAVFLLIFVVFIVGGVYFICPEKMKSTSQVVEVPKTQQSNV